METSERTYKGATNSIYLDTDIVEQIKQYADAYSQQHPPVTVRVPQTSESPKPKPWHQIVNGNYFAALCNCVSGKKEEFREYCKTLNNQTSTEIEGGGLRAKSNIRYRFESSKDQMLFDEVLQDAARAMGKINNIAKCVFIRALHNWGKDRVAPDVNVMENDSRKRDLASEKNGENSRKRMNIASLCDDEEISTDIANDRGEGGANSVVEEALFDTAETIAISVPVDEPRARMDLEIINRGDRKFTLNNALWYDGKDEILGPDREIRGIMRYEADISGQRLYVGPCYASFENETEFLNIITQQGDLFGKEVFVKANREKKGNASAVYELGANTSPSLDASSVRKRGAEIGQCTVLKWESERGEMGRRPCMEGAPSIQNDGKGHRFCLASGTNGKDKIFAQVQEGTLVAMFSSGLHKKNRIAVYVSNKTSKFCEPSRIQESGANIESSNGRN